MSQSSKPPPLPKNGKFLFKCGDHSKILPVKQDPTYGKSSRGKEEWQYAGSCNKHERKSAKAKIEAAEKEFDTATKTLSASNVPQPKETCDTSQCEHCELEEEFKKKFQTQVRIRDEAEAKVKDDFGKKWNESIYRTYSFEQMLLDAWV